MNSINNTEFYKAHLVLNVSDIADDPDPANYPISNSIGAISGARSAFTWYNLDMRDILGDMYDKFDYFNLNLRAIQYDSGIGSYGSSSLDLNVYFQMSGPAFYSSTYNVATKRSNGETTLGVAFMTRNVPATITYNNNFTTTFQKQPTMNFSVALRRANDSNVITGAGTLYPLFSFNFYITPVEYAISEKPKPPY